MERILSNFRSRFPSLLDWASSTITYSQSGDPESFTIDATRTDKSVTATITAGDESGLRYALNALRHWYTESTEAKLAKSDRPAFGIRGVIEGFYGIPWTHSQRLRGVANLADFNMNTFMIAPKDSPWQRFKWREPFNGDFLKQSAELVEAGRDHGLSVAICVSPGLSVQYSSEADREALMVRYRQLQAIGVRHFGLLFDDIPWELSSAEDEAKYATTALAQADFSNAIYAALKELDSNAILTVCPMHYCGRGTEPYLHDMGRALNPEINLFWTGRSICSEYLEIFDAKIFEETTKRPPLYWDNFPVNDGSMRHSIFIGPVQQREAGLEAHSAGLLSNPMTQFEISQLPIGTVGEYLWNSRTYDPYAAWERSLSALVPHEGDRKALRGLFRCTMGTVTGGDPAPDLRPVFATGTTARREGRLKDSATIFRTAGEQMLADHQTLISPSFSRPEVIEEIKPWISKFELGAQTLIALARIIESCEFDSAERSLKANKNLAIEAGALRDALDRNQAKMFGDQIDGSLWELMIELGYTA